MRRIDSEEYSITIAILDKIYRDIRSMAIKDE
jgi:hypothetical protein